MATVTAENIGWRYLSPTWESAVSDSGDPHHAGVTAAYCARKCTQHSTPRPTHTHISAQETFVYQLNMMRTGQQSPVSNPALDQQTSRRICTRTASGAPRQQVWCYSTAAAKRSVDLSDPGYPRQSRETKSEEARRSSDRSRMWLTGAIIRETLDGSPRGFLTSIKEGSLCGGVGG